MDSKNQDINSAVLHINKMLLAMSLISWRAGLPRCCCMSNIGGKMSNLEHDGVWNLDRRDSFIGMIGGTKFEA